MSDNTTNTNESGDAQSPNAQTAANAGAAGTVTDGAQKANDGAQSGSGCELSQGANVQTVAAASTATAASPAAPAAAASTQPAAPSPKTATSNEPRPEPHKDGGAVLTAAASSSPSLIATVEVYRSKEGKFFTNLHTPEGQQPQHSTDDPDEVRGAVDEFLTVKLSA